MKEKRNMFTYLLILFLKFQKLDFVNSVLQVFEQMMWVALKKNQL